MSLIHTYRHWLGMGLVIIMHAVGLVAIATDLDSSLLPMTPVNLWLCGGVAALLHVLGHLRDVIWLAAVYLLGFGVECLGVNTGFPFGEYAYLPNFGAQAWGTPWVIGMNWLLLALGAVTLLRQWTSHPVILALGTGAIMTAIDVLIEPLAPLLGFWAFEASPVPLANYLSWFVLGSIAGTLVQRTKTVHNPTAIVLLLLQIVFFSVLLLRYGMHGA